VVVGVSRLRMAGRGSIMPAWHFPGTEGFLPRRAVCRASDRIDNVMLPAPQRLRPPGESLRRVLLHGDRAAIAGICQQLAIPAVEIDVPAVRPHDGRGELHGMYQPADRCGRARFVWMRAAKQQRVIAFRSFLRTLLHELCHHVDYECLKLAESFHTEGFYRRESGLFRKVVHVAEQQELALD